MKKYFICFALAFFIMGSWSSVQAAGGFTFSKSVYKSGTEHKDVQVIQQALKKDGVYTYDKITSYYGSITEKAVKAFQKKYGLKEDGIVGKGTIHKMKELGLVDASLNTASRGYGRNGKGEYLDWWSEVSGVIVNRQDVLLVEDLGTGKTFQVKVTAGTNHADVEPLTMDDTTTMKSIWGGFSWDRRPVLVYKSDRVIAASMTNMPHAGVESKPAGETVSNRSGGYGTGYNFDFVKGNGIDGHVDLHFKNSLRHKDDKKDPQHQAAVKKAAGI
ncbi:MAG: peptidoglycan-binding domain-containing protein [Bacillota bacterium]